MEKKSLSTIVTKQTMVIFLYNYKFTFCSIKGKYQKVIKTEQGFIMHQFPT